MIQKEKIIQRRKEIAEIRHADSVFRDIQAREKERPEYEKRWVWELLQNAKDSIEENQTVSVKIDISENEISFSHTGNPFDLDEILSLIIQGSSKNAEPGKIGRFGTGFMTTYLLSREVMISGKLIDDGGYFEFNLNRNASDNDAFYIKQQESNSNFEESIREKSYLGTSNFQTKFSYSLNALTKSTAKVGLDCINELIPITQLFNQEIDSVILKEGNKETVYIKSFIKDHIFEKAIIKEWELKTLINDKIKSQFKAYVFHGSNYEVCIITHNIDGYERVFRLTENYPRLYFTFPLIGTEEIGIPFIINSTMFEPRTERDGIYLQKGNEDGDETINKQIVRLALIESAIPFSKLLLDKKIEGIFELFNFDLSKPLKWMDHDWFNTVKSEVIDSLSSLELLRVNNISKDTLISLNDLIIPYSNESQRLWKLLSSVTELHTPLKNELESWNKVIQSIGKIKNLNTHDLKSVFGVTKLISFVEDKGNYDNLVKVLNINPDLWLKDFYSIINDELGRIPLDKNIMLNQNNAFREGEGMVWDECKDDEIIRISKLLGLNFPNYFISKSIKQFSIVGIDKVTKQEAINKIKINLNNLNDTSFSKKEIQQSNALFLKLLIENDLFEIIKDLKILIGSKNDENIDFHTFPKTDHLLLTPKVFFGPEYPLYASIIREKDCMHDVYNDYLTEEHYTYLSENGFIHYSPIVIREEIADKRIIELLIVKEDDLVLLKDSDGQINQKIKLKYSDFAYLTTSQGHIYERNSTQKSSLERLEFLLIEAVEKDPLFVEDFQEIKIEGIDRLIQFHKCLWVYRAKKLSWIYIKTENDSNEIKISNETPSSKNLSELIKGNNVLIKLVKGIKQQLFLNKMAIGVSDLIRNSLPSDELRIKWDKAITNMITSDVDPELVQVIFNDPSIKKEYEKRLNERKLISRNKRIGELIEALFKEIILELKENGILVEIKREPFGSDYLLTDDSSDLINEKLEREGFKINDWLIELKATGKDYAAMTPLQAEIASKNKDTYALIVIPLDKVEPDLEFVRKNAKVISFIGSKLYNITKDFKEMEIQKVNLLSGQDGISLDIENQNIRFKISSAIWNLKEVQSIQTFMTTNFVNTRKKEKSS